jgi:hypothetical protein
VTFSDDRFLDRLRFRVLELRDDVARLPVDRPLVDRPVVERFVVARFAVDRFAGALVDFEVRDFAVPNFEVRDFAVPDLDVRDFDVWEERFFLAVPGAARWDAISPRFLVPAVMTPEPPSVPAR